MADVDQNRLPDFLAVGPPRTATTWLERILAGHVGLPAGIKETAFFTKNYDLGLPWYARHFQTCQSALPVGEICPVYFDSSEARDRIARHIPEVRVIITLRDPVQRLYSHYRLLRREGWIGALTLDQALAKDLNWSGAGNLHGSNRYATHVAEWQRMFGAGRVLVLIHDDLIAAPQTFLDRVCNFVGIAGFEITSAQGRERINTVERAPLSPRLARYARKIREQIIRRQWYRMFEAGRPLWDRCAGGGEYFAPLPPEVEGRLRAQLRPEVDSLEALLNRDLSPWKEIQHGVS